MPFWLTNYIWSKVIKYKITLYMANKCHKKNCSSVLLLHYFHLLQPEKLPFISYTFKFSFGFFDVLVRFLFYKILQNRYYREYIFFNPPQHLKVPKHCNVLKNLKGSALLFAIWYLERYAKLWFQIQLILSGIAKEDHTEQRGFNRFVWTPGSAGKKIPV